MNNVINSKQKGALGEQIACRFLVKRGFRVLDRNYQKKWGEIDIVAEKDNILHFIEVKSTLMRSELRAVDDWRPEENVHRNKLLRMQRTIQSYLAEKSIDPDREFVIDVVTVEINMQQRSGRVNFIENIIV